MKRFPLVLALVAGSASAQIVPGVRAPETAHDAMEIGQLVGCTFAVTGRPTPVESAEARGAEGLTHHAAAPEAMLAAAGMSAEGTLAFTITNPEGEVWLLNNPSARRCAVATLAGDLAANEAAFVAGMTANNSFGYREARGAEAGTRRYEARNLGLTLVFKSPTGPGTPFVVITEGRR